jgi:hypothetical protein
MPSESRSIFAIEGLPFSVGYRDGKQATSRAKTLSTAFALNAADHIPATSFPNSRPNH